MASDPKVLTPAYYQRLYEIQQAHGWARGMRVLAGALLDPVATTRSSWRILDLGCGTGAMLEWLRRFPGARVAGLDVSMDALAFCQARGYRELIQGSAQELPFSDGSFNLVVCTDVLQHLPDPPGDGAALKEAGRVLAPGGYIYIRTNSQFGLGSPIGEERANYRRYSREEIVASLDAAGFVVERATYANAVPSLLAVARDRVTRRAERAREHDLGLRLRIRPRPLRWVDDVLANLLAVEALYVTKLGGALPFGHSVVALARKPGASPPSTE